MFHLTMESPTYLKKLLIDIMIKSTNFSYIKADFRVIWLIVITNCFTPGRLALRFNVDVHLIRLEHGRVDQPDNRARVM